MTQSGETYRTKCGGGRATYSPEWDSVLPWVVYVRGEAVGHRGSLMAAKQLLYDFGCETDEDFRMVGGRPYCKCIVLMATAVWNGVVNPSVRRGRAS